MESSLHTYFIAFTYVQGTALGELLRVLGEDMKVRMALFWRSIWLSHGVKTCLYDKVECGSAIKKCGQGHLGGSVG